MRNYVGKAGQLAVMAEFLLRGYNVAMPEVDVGDDIFVVHDLKGRFWRIQVKTALGKRRDYGYSGQFAVRAEQLRRRKKPDLHYVFALRRDSQWEFVLLRRKTLLALQETLRPGSPSGPHVVFNFRFKAAQVLCAHADLQPYRNDWSAWPITPGEPPPAATPTQ